MSRLALARSRLDKDDGQAVGEYRARMGGYLDAALTLITRASADALENLKDNPDDENTQRAIIALAAATQALDPLVTKLCPRTSAHPPAPIPEAANG